MCYTHRLSSLDPLPIGLLCGLYLALLALPFTVLADGSRAEGDEFWIPDFYENGVNNNVRDMTTYDGKLIVVGDFTEAGDIPASRVAAWYGAHWSALGSGPNAAVMTAIEYDGDLIVGGGFSYVDGIEAWNSARWDGQAWYSFGFFSATVRCMTIYQGDLIVGGGFGSVSGVGVGYIARWDGENWYPFGGGFASSGPSVLQVYDGEVYAGGSFHTDPQGQLLNGIARWDGEDWQPLGEGFDDTVESLCVYDGKLIAGGAFEYTGDLCVNHIAAWNGDSWEPLGTGMAPEYWAGVEVLTEYQGSLYAGGGFLTAGGTSADMIARWNGSDWYALGSGCSGGRVYAFSEFNGGLICAGTIDEAGGTSTEYIAHWHPPATGIALPTPAKKWQLLEPVPNPFNPSVTITFTLDTFREIQLSIHDLAGRRVTVLAKGSRPAGRGEVIWHGLNQAGDRVASGVYFVKMTSANQTEIKKLVLVK